REPGRKILVSGGGRCNVLPAADAPGRFVSGSAGRLVRRFLDRWPLEEQRVFFEALLGGALREEPETGKLFPPTDRARDVRDALRETALRAGAEIRSGCPVRDLVRAPDGSFELRLDGETVRADAVVVATGGRSVLPAGADAAGFSWAASLGHTVRPLYPALVPLVGDAPEHHALSGVSCRARVTARSGDEATRSEGGFLFTHRGWSGPAVLDVSHLVARAGPAARVTASFGDESEWERSLLSAVRSGASLGSALRNAALPDRLAALLLGSAGVPDQPLSRLTREARRKVVATLAEFPIPATGTEGWRTAEVTGGGVALEEVDPGSGESRRVPGLFFAGEILDAFGPIGGFNFQWAWATGRTAGAAAARRVTP
ncbi:MAG TPA: aminoacetone oxidase family FAD-binding enzyme, partial [Thermoanaerobaculia bacterium]|nr:aminoacetone oxidase family FAD-binding enzyme [Thermoanaerobaculia bacterium]